MKPPIKFFLVLAAATAVVFASRAFAATDDLKTKIEVRSRELETINNQINETQGKLNELGTQSRTLSKEIKSTEYTIKSLELGIRSSEINIEKLGLELEGLGNDLESAKNKIKDKRTSISFLVRELDKRERSGLLETILSKGTLADTVFEIDSLSRIQGSLSEEIDALRNLSADIDDNMKLIADRKNRLEEESGSLKVKKVVVEEEKSYKNTILAETKNKESAYQKQLSILEKRQEEISGEIDKLEESLRATAGTAPSRVGNILSLPIAKKFPITQEYGATKFAKRAYKTQFHNGMDFGVAIGTPVYASLSGKVIAAGNNGHYQYGKHVLIEHDNGLVTLYAHLSKHAVSVGQRVETGQLIAYSGNTGYSTGAHLHLTVYFEPSYCRETRVGDKCVQLKNFGAAGLVPVGTTINPADYLNS